MSKISIIIPVYNTAEFVERCLDSALAQKGVEVECIVVDDCGQDDSMSIVQRYTDRRIKIIRHDRNRGQAAGRNTGLKASCGEWIVYLDSDDSLPEDALRLMLDNASPETDWVQGGFNRISPGKEWQTLYPKGRYTSHDQIAENFEKLNWMNVAGKLINRRTATAIPFNETLYFEDTLWCMEAYAKTENIVAVDIPVYNHYFRLGSTMQSPFTKKKAESQLSIIERIVAMGPDKNLEHSATFLALNMIKNLYLGDFSGRYKKELSRKLRVTGVGKMAIDRKSLPPFTKLLSYNLRWGCDFYYGALCKAYKIYKK